MANTTYEEIYARCRTRIRDYDKEGYTDELFAKSERDLLDIAIDDFSVICAQDLSDRNEELGEFNFTLSPQEQGVLSLSMIVHWLEPYLYNSDALKNAMSTKDFTLFSPANLLREMTELLDQSHKRLNRKINDYSYRVNKVSKLTE